MDGKCCWMLLGCSSANSQFPLPTNNLSKKEIGDVALVVNGFEVSCQQMNEDAKAFEATYGKEGKNRSAWGSKSLWERKLEPTWCWPTALLPRNQTLGHSNRSTYSMPWNAKYNWKGFQNGTNSGKAQCYKCTADLSWNDWQGCESVLEHWTRNFQSLWLKTKGNSYCHFYDYELHDGVASITRNNR